MLINTINQIFLILLYMTLDIKLMDISLKWDQHALQN